MTNEMKLEGTKLTVLLSGRIDATSAPKLEEELEAALGGVTELILDLTNLEYISSAGLRVLLANQKKMNTQGSMTLINVKDEIMEIFDVTGFSDILNIEAK